MQLFLDHTSFGRMYYTNYILANYNITTLIERNNMKQSLLIVDQCYENVIVFCGWTIFQKIDQCIDDLPVFCRDTNFERMHQCTSLSRIYLWSVDLLNF